MDSRPLRLHRELNQIVMLPLIGMLASALGVLPPLADISQVARGQRGECLTVFEGDTIEPMSFEVKGVMRDFLGPKKDIVLVRLVGEKPEFTGVVAGMSGSPCYVGGKLVGALAYAFASFAKEPIAGITPMDGMLEVMRLPSEARPWRDALAKTSPQDWEALRSGAAAPVSGGGGELRPIATPLALAGLTPRVFEHFAPWLRSMGLEPVATGGGGDGAAPEPLAPGSAVAAVLVQGDVDMAATGTVTSVEGNEVLAFGHPFMGAGAVSFPMANATILNTMASQMRSFKMSQTGAVIGEVTQDRLTAIGGHLGEAPPMIPVHGTFDIAGQRETFELRVARDPNLSPRLLAIALAGSLGNRVPAGERGTLTMRTVLKSPQAEPVVIDGLYAADRGSGLFIMPAIEVAQTFNALWNTPFGPPPGVSIEVTAKFDVNPVEEYVETVHVDRGVVMAGDAVNVVVALREVTSGQVRRESFHLPVPQAWEGRTVTLVAAGADGVNDLRQGTGGPIMARSEQDIRRWLNERRRQGALYLVALSDEPSLRFRASHLDALPPSVVATLSGESASVMRRRSLVWEERQARPGVVYGGGKATIHVEKSYK